MAVEPLFFSPSFQALACASNKKMTLIGPFFVFFAQYTYKFAAALLIIVSLKQRGFLRGIGHVGDEENPDSIGCPVDGAARPCRQKKYG
ncbi:hypothetical protein ACFS07_34710 [Undibacterium arcticum]